MGYRRLSALSSEGLDPRFRETNRGASAGLAATSSEIASLWASPSEICAASSVGPLPDIDDVGAVAQNNKLDNKRGRRPDEWYGRNGTVA
jgi:hypothetical protein